MKILTRDDILSVNDIYIEECPVPEWGGVVYVKTLTGAERNIIEKNTIELGRDGKPKGAKLEYLTAYIAFTAVCDQEGNRLFTDIKDVQKLANKSAAALDRVAALAQKLAGMSPADIESLVVDLKNDLPADLPTV